MGQQYGINVMAAASSSVGAHVAFGNIISGVMDVLTGLHSDIPAFLRVFSR
jgi:hypothetical protein